MLADDAALEAVWMAPASSRRMPASAVHLNMGTVSLRHGQAHGGAARGGGQRATWRRPSSAGRTSPPRASSISSRPDRRRRSSVAGRSSARSAAGPSSSGAEPHLANAVKIARNFLLASLVESLGEALALVRKSGVDPAVFLDVITGTSFDRRYRDYGRRMVEEDFEPTFPLRLGLKDVELALAAAADSGVPLPTAELLREQHLAAIADGFGEKDWAALGAFIARRAGLA